MAERPLGRSKTGGERTVSGHRPDTKRGPERSKTLEGSLLDLEKQNRGRSGDKRPHCTLRSRVGALTQVKRPPPNATRVDRLQ